jgi:hypothetical protein
MVRYVIDHSRSPDPDRHILRGKDFRAIIHLVNYSDGDSFKNVNMVGRAVMVSVAQRRKELQAAIEGFMARPDTGLEIRQFQSIHWIWQRELSIIFWLLH